MSDYVERLPLFKQWKNAISNSANDGAYEGLAPRLHELMGGMFPVGVEDDGRINVPAAFDPTSEVPVLIGRTTEQIDIGALVGASALAKNLLRQPTAVPCAAITYGNGKVGGFCATGYLPIEYMDQDLYLAVPSFIGIDPKYVSQAAAVTAHELDHWDYYLAYPPLQKTDVMPVVTLAERRAHSISLRVGLNLGSVTLNALEQTIAVPLQEESMIRNTRVVVEKARELAHGCYWGGLAAGTLTHHYGPSDLQAQATAREVRAYDAAGIIGA